MWSFVHRAITRGEPYPVTVEEGVEVVRVSELARAKSGYVPHESALSGKGC